MTEHIAKFSQMENVAITFTEEEAKKLLHPHIDALVISLRIANSRVHRILVNNRSSADILFKSVLTQINLGGAPGAKLTPVLTPLYGFAGECVRAEGVITLPVTMGEDLAQKTRMVNFLVVDHLSIYNAIIGQPTPNAMRAVTSTYHLMMKFPIENGIGVVVGSQKEARICYVNATNGESSAKGKEVISTIYQIDGDLPTDLSKDLGFVW